jgi:hypothetical protein
MDTDPVPEGLVAFSFQFVTRLSTVFAEDVGGFGFVCA